MKSVIVFGATGAMGTPLLNYLRQNDDLHIYATSRRQQHDDHVHWIQCDAKNFNEIQEVFQERYYDAIVDFLVYDTDTFSKRVRWLLEHTSQYIFISSARVYAESKGVISEDMPRILDVCTDEEYLSHDYYDLAKARQENLLMQSSIHNYTIIRPSLTYNSNRLQFTLFEKDEWIYRPMIGKSIIFPVDMASIRTTMTWGDDVANVISQLVLNEKAVGEIFNVSGGGSLTWEEVLKIYINALEKNLGREIKVVSVDNASKIAKDLNRYYQYRYARGISREFNNEKVKGIIDMDRVQYHSIEEGLSKCIDQFFHEGARVAFPGPKMVAYQDRLAREYVGISPFDTVKRKIGYLAYRTGILR